jgi:hypothetical protein
MSFRFWIKGLNDTNRNGKQYIKEESKKKIFFDKEQMFYVKRVGGLASFEKVWSCERVKRKMLKIEPEGYTKVGTSKLKV